MGRPLWTFPYLQSPHLFLLFYKCNFCFFIHFPHLTSATSTFACFWLIENLNLLESFVQGEDHETNEGKTVAELLPTWCAWVEDLDDEFEKKEGLLFIENIKNIWFPNDTLEKDALLQGTVYIYQDSSLPDFLTQFPRKLFFFKFGNCRKFKQLL